VFGRESEVRRSGREKNVYMVMVVRIGGALVGRLESGCCIAVRRTSVVWVTYSDRSQK